MAFSNALARLYAMGGTPDFAINSQTLGRSPGQVTPNYTPVYTAPTFAQTPLPAQSPLPAPVTMPGGTTVQPPAPTPAPVTGTNALSPQMQALNNFADSAGMQFQLKQGENAIQNNYAAHGALQSGAAMKALQSYGQQTALNNYFMPYMGLLGGQQSVGAGAASSIAGVGQNFGNTVAGLNGQLAGYIGNGADAASNAALARGANTGQMWTGIGSALGSLASSFAPTPHY